MLSVIPLKTYIGSGHVIAHARSNSRCLVPLPPHSILQAGIAKSVRLDMPTVSVGNRLLVETT